MLLHLLGKLPILLNLLLEELVFLITPDMMHGAFIVHSHQAVINEMLHLTLQIDLLLEPLFQTLLLGLQLIISRHLLHDFTFAQLFL